jgi:hypothetical protein
VQQHQRQEAVHLRLVGHQFGQRPPESQRLGGQLAAGGRGRVALVEDQVDDREHGEQPVGQQVIGGHPEGNPGALDLALGAHQSLRHRRLAEKERTRDLAGAQAAERAQCERDLRLGGERRVTAGEDQLQALVWEGRGVHGVSCRLVLHCLGYLQQAGLRGQRTVATDAVDRAVAGRPHQPRTGVGGLPVVWPARGGDRKGLLRGLLGEVEVAEEADQCSEDPSPLLAEYALQECCHAATTPADALRPRRPCSPRGCARPARSPRRGRRPRRTGSRRPPP